ncbi:XPO6 protein, partial [Atractosteus spatula]|nr:XPO6 protein [Atractosteus spatula]
MWLGVPSQDKMEIRSCLPKLLLSEHKALPYFIRNKLCKVIVDIGRQDWPMFYHDFFTNTLQVSPSLGRRALCCKDQPPRTLSVLRRGAIG